MSFELSSRWENSLVAEEYTMGNNTPTDPATRIDLTNFYEWTLSLGDAISLVGGPLKISFCFEDPAVAPNTPIVTLGVIDPTGISLLGQSTIASSQGVNFPTGQATIWVFADAPRLFKIVIWGSRRV